MAKVLVIAEHRDGKIKNTTYEVVFAFSKAGMETHVALIGKGVDALSSEIGHYGASKIHLIQDDKLENYTAEAYTAALATFIESHKPDYVVTSHTPTGRDLMPHLSAKLQAGLASDCHRLELSGDGVKAWRPVYAGKAVAEVEFLGNGPKLLTIRPNALGTPIPDTSKSADSETVNATLGDFKTQFIETLKGGGERPDVTEASIVVSGGRAMKNPENFKILEELADVLGAAVGASRAAVDSGYRPHRDQVGQTGKVVSPQLYLACGISGAIQHLAGMRTSKCIVAINTDPEAPIYQLADYGIVNDLFEMVPLLTPEFKKAKEN